MKTLIACTLFAAGFACQPTFAAPTPRAPRIQWQTVLGGEKEDWPGLVIEGDDGSVFIEGVSNSPLGGNKTSPLLDSHYWPANFEDFHYAYGGDVWVVKLDKAGAKKWDRSFGTPGDDSAGNMILNSDGSLWISGKGFHGEVIPLAPSIDLRTNRAWFIGTQENFLARIDSNGQAAWQFLEANFSPLKC